MPKAPNEVSAAELYELLGVNKTTVNGYVKSGLFKPLRHGVYDLNEAVPAVCQHLRDVAAGSGNTADLAAERARLVREQADFWATRNKRQSGKLLPADMVGDVFGDLMSVCRTRILAIPHRAAPEMMTVRSPAEAAEILDRLVREALEEIASGKLDEAYKLVVEKSAEASY